MRTLEVILGRERLSEVDSSALPALLGLCRAVNVRAHWDEQDGTLYIEPPAMGKRLTLATGATDGPLSLQIVARLKDVVEQAGVSVVVKPAEQNTTEPPTVFDLSVEVSDHGSYGFDLPSQIAEGVYAGLARYWADPTGPACEEEPLPEETVQHDRPDLPEMRMILYPDPDLAPEPVLEVPDSATQCLGASETGTEAEIALEEPLARLHGARRTAMSASFEVPPTPVSAAPSPKASMEVSKPLFSRLGPVYSPFQPPGGGEYVVFQHPQVPAPRAEEPETSLPDPAEFFRQFAPEPQPGQVPEVRPAPASAAPDTSTSVPAAVSPPAALRTKAQPARRDRPALIIQNSGAVIRLP